VHRGEVFDLHGRRSIELVQQAAFAEAAAVVIGPYAGA
jgi:hypothetical protein